MNPVFLKEWSPKQMTHVQKSVRRFIVSRYWETHHSPAADPFIIGGNNSFDGIDKVLGLAYTSSSAYAGLWPCNTELYLDNAHKFSLTGFVLDSNGFVHAIWSDRAENEISFPI